MAHETPAPTQFQPFGLDFDAAFAEADSAGGGALSLSSIANTGPSPGLPDYGLLGAGLSFVGIPPNWIFAIIGFISSDASDARNQEIADFNRAYEIDNFESALGLAESILTDIAPHVQGLSDFLSAQSEDFFSNVPGKIAAIAGSAAASSAEIKAFSQDRFDAGIAQLQGFGEQARININQAATNTGSNIQQDLVRRGLAGTSVAPSGAAFVEGGRLNALGNLDAQLASQATALFTDLSGDVLNTLTDQQAFNTNLGFSTLGTSIDAFQTGLSNQFDLQTAPFNFFTNAAQGVIDVRSGLSLQPPPAQNLTGPITAGQFVGTAAA